MGKILVIFSDLIWIENILKLKIFSIFYSFSFIPIIYYSFLDFYTIFSFILLKISITLYISLNINSIKVK